MGLEIVDYTKERESAVSDFNNRLMRAGISYRFPERCVSEWLPKKNREEIYQEYFLVMEGSVVRGGYILKHQVFIINNNKEVCIADYQLPLSEGIINKAYNLVGIQLLTDALKRQSLLFAYGIGSYNEPLARMLKIRGWKMFLVPFFFWINNPINFFKNINYLRKKKWQIIILDFLTVSGLGYIFTRGLQALLTKEKLSKKNIFYEIVEDFSLWADELWEKCKRRYFFIGERDSYVLNKLYPKKDKRFIRLKVLYKSNIVGWAVVLDTQMQTNKYFGAMRVGSIVDCLSLPEDAEKVIFCAKNFLKKREVDIIVSNQAHKQWCRALRKAGFFRGPSNCIFAASKQLSRLLYPLHVNKEKFHLNRGDGDGPIHL
jgi:hypothetical protein